MRQISQFWVKYRQVYKLRNSYTLGTKKFLEKLSLEKARSLCLSLWQRDKQGEREDLDWTQ